MQETRSDNTLLDLITCMRKHLFGMVLVFAVIFGGTVLYTLKQTPIFEVESRVLVKYGREYVYHSVEGTRKGDNSPFFTYNNATVINTELEIFKSPQLAEKVLQSVGVEKVYPELAKTAENNEQLLTRAVSRFESMLDVHHIKGSSVIGVAFQHNNPELAVEIVDDLIERFKEKHLEVFKNSQYVFLEQQVGEYREQLRVAEKEKIAFKQKYRIFSLENQRKSLMQQFVNLNTRLISEKVDLADSESRIAGLEQELDNVPEMVVQGEDSTLGSSQESSELHLLQLKLQERDLLEKYPETNRLVVQVRENIAMVEQFLDDHKVTFENSRTGKNPLYLKIESDLADARVKKIAQEKRIDSFEKSLEELRNRLQSLSALEIELKRLDEEIDIIGSRYKDLNEKLAQVRIQQAMDSEKMVNVVVIENPRVPAKPIKPNKQLRILIGIILGMASSLFYALFVEYALARKV